MSRAEYGIAYPAITSSSEDGVTLDRPSPRTRGILDPLNVRDIFFPLSRLNVEGLKKQGVCVLPWTVNKKEEMELFKNVYKIPFLTDILTAEENS